MNSSGVCVKNTCNKTQYPYSQHPLTDIGEVETCYEGNPNASTDISLMYNPYYGYTSCKSDFSQGEMWKQDDTNPRMCVCDRSNPSENWYLPYGNDEYKEVSGFNVGIRGESINCTDNDSSYYGYKRCFIGRKMDTSIPGRCNDAPTVGYTYTYGYGDIWINNLGKILRDIGGYSASNECIARNKHYQALDGTRLGDDSVLSMLIPGCDNGDEEQCNECHSITNLDKKADGLYTVHNKFDLRINIAGSRRLYGMFTCPVDGEYVYKRAGSMTVCYKYCKLSELSKCYDGDVLVDDSNGNYKLARVSSGSTSSLKLFPYKGAKTGQNWNQAMAWATNFYPGIDEGNEYYKNHPIFGQGKWALATTSNHGASEVHDKFLNYVGWTEGTGSPCLCEGIWLSNEADANTAYYRVTYNSVALDKNELHNAVPMMILNY